MSHGIGPHQNVRQNLKELYSAIEEAKADVTGLFMLQYLSTTACAHGAKAEQELYTTFLASAFRSVRFGLTEAHGKGMALQFNYLTDKGAFVANPGRHLRGGSGQDQRRRARPGARPADHRGRGQLRRGEAHAGYARL